MNYNFKIIFAVSFAFLISLSILFFGIGQIESQIVPIQFQKKFYNEYLDNNSNKIFILGSSEAHRLNATYIEKYISNFDGEYKVYNLSVHADTPQRRANTINEIISSEPVLVIYGIGFRDFEVPKKTPWEINRAESVLPDPPRFVDQISFFEEVLHYDFENLRSPKLLTQRLMREAVGLSSVEVSESMLKTNTPFFKYELDRMSEIKSDEQLRKQYDEWRWNAIKLPNKNLALFSLGKMISQFEENKIKSIVFSTPSPKYELNEIGNADIEVFEESLEQLSGSNDVKIEFLHKKYKDLPIFNSGNHVAMNKDAIIFSKDIAEIILKEIES